MSVTNLAVVMIVGDESIHIQRSIKNIKQLTSNIFIVDSYSQDDTHKLAQKMGAIVVQREWRNHADQYQWALINCPFKVDWVLRMDADELLDEELMENIKAFILSPPTGVTGCILNRKHIFLGKWIRWGGGAIRCQ